MRTCHRRADSPIVEFTSAHQQIGSNSTMRRPSPTRLAFLVVSSVVFTAGAGGPGRAQTPPGGTWVLEGMPQPLIQNAPLAKAAPKFIVAKPKTPRPVSAATASQPTTTSSIAPLVADQAIPAALPLPQRDPLQGKRALVAFKSAPFPYQGARPYDEQPFFDHIEEGRRGRPSVRTGEILWEDKTYNDNRALLYVPKGFAPTQPALIVLYFHGHDTRLVRDVERRQGVLHQVEQSGLNAVVVAPQFALDAPDSSAGKFWQSGALATFVDEAVGHLARLSGNKRANDKLQKSSIVIVAYSGGYAPAAWALHHGGLGERIAGVVVLDGMYGEYQKFADWIDQRRDAFFISAYGASSRDGNIELRRLIVDRPHRTVAALPAKLERGAITFVAAPSEVRHQDFVVYAWTKDPISDVLMRLPQFARR